MGAGIKVGETIYTLDDIDQIPMGDLFVLKSFTHAQGYGVELKTINAMLTGLGEKANDPEFDSADLVGDLEFLANIIGLIYIVRRCAGEKITPADAWATPVQGWQFIDSDEDGEGDAPKGEAPPPVETVS